VENLVRAVLISLDGDLLELLETLDHLQLVGLIDADPNVRDRSVANLGSDDVWPSLKQEHPGLKAILAIDPPSQRERLAAFYGEDSLLTVVAPDAQVALHAEIGNGSIIQRRALISRNVKIGRACKINHAASMHHDASVGDYSTVAPSAVLLGHVAVGRSCYIGAGAIVLPRRRIGDGATIGAGAVVTRDVPAGSTASGVPAKTQASATHQGYHAI
jgi:sugar O-acyltransferase (sialic acid O-acetyltransferase NeuD family)